MQLHSSKSDFAHKKRASSGGRPRRGGGAKKVEADWVCSPIIVSAWIAPRWGAFYAYVV